LILNAEGLLHETTDEPIADISEGEAEEYEMSEKVELTLMIVTVIMMVIYILTGAICEHRKCKFGHETGLILILGFIVSGCIFMISNKQIHW
jgi:hypothetical protein